MRFWEVGQTNRLGDQGSIKIYRHRRKVMATRMGHFTLVSVIAALVMLAPLGSANAMGKSSADRRLGLPNDRDDQSIRQRQFGQSHRCAPDSQSFRQRQPGASRQWLWSEPGLRGHDHRSGRSEVIQISTLVIESTREISGQLRLPRIVYQRSGKRIARPHRWPSHPQTISKNPFHC
jgi:hypothetical protein